MDQRTPHHPPPDVPPRKRPAQRLVPKPCLHWLLQYGGSRRPRQCTAGTIKPLVESWASRSDDRRGMVNDATTRKCTAVDTKPATARVAIVDNGAFKARTTDSLN